MVVDAADAMKQVNTPPHSPRPTVATTVASQSVLVETQGYVWVYFDDVTEGPRAKYSLVMSEDKKTARTLQGPFGVVRQGGVDILIKSVTI